MAKVTDSSDSHLSGKIAGKVYSQYNGSTYVRKAPTIRKDARTPGQLLNQQRFKEINRFCKVFKTSLIPRIWQDAAVNTTGYRLFLKANSPAFAKDGSIADPLLLKFSVGDLRMPEGLTAQRTDTESNTIQVSWEKEYHIKGFRLIDELMVISFNGLQFSPMTSTGLFRKDLQGNFNLPALPEGAGYIYLFFRAEDRRDFSESRGFRI